MGKASRDKGARSERALRDELIRHGWQDVVRVPLSGAVKTRPEYQSDVSGRPPGLGTEITFENKARAAGFDPIYALLPHGTVSLSFIALSGECVVLSLDPNESIRVTYFIPIESYDPKIQKVLNSVLKKCRDWIGTAQILSLKQDRKPFLYIRYRK